jgi:hypothetical protein
MNKTPEQKQLDFETMQIKATENGFELKPFKGYALIEVNSGADLYFENLNDVNNYIDACDLSDAELKEKYCLTSDEIEIAAKKLKENKNLNFCFVCNGESDFSTFERRTIGIEQKINQGARRLTEWKLHR